ncbi:hypothetical protein EAO27_11170 [Sphingopyxis sp. YF1]|nr:hypothetical protein EAO27_11170 [Sphingopyxis sp. YF1]
MSQPVKPTDSEREIVAGRIALWLDPADLEWLSERCDCPNDAPAEQRDRCARIRFRSRSALHKAGLVGS